MMLTEAYFTIIPEAAGVGMVGCESVAISPESLIGRYVVGFGHVWMFRGSEVDLAAQRL